MSLSTTSNTTTATKAYTHGGMFHADDVMSAVILTKVFGEIEICRVLKVPDNVGNAIVFDIGDGRFDHHQAGGNGKRANGVPYSSAGLIWKEFGREIIGVDDPNVEEIWSIVDQELIMGIDAHDNGKELNALALAVKAFNPAWNETSSSDECFVQAVQFAGQVFDRVLANARAKALATSIVEEAIAVSEDGVMVLSRFVPWQEAVLGSENPKAKEVLFAVYPSLRGGYNWQAVPDKISSFGQRKAVPNSWKGLKGSDLQKVTGVATATFCHPGGFIGGADELNDAIAMARLAIAAEEA